MMHSILIIGQSNMAGRGDMCDVPMVENDKLFVLRNGRWRPMYRPVNPDRGTAGVCLAESFADLYSKDHPGVDVGIIPCADGGTGIDQWCVGGLLFDHACYMAELASRTSTIAAVLWHQGEADCTEVRYPVYEEKLKVVLDAFREKLGLQDVPFIIGELGSFIENNAVMPYLKNHPYINKALNNVAESDKMIGIASSEGLRDKGDDLHFCSESLLELGERYYREFLKLEDKNKVFAEKATPDNAIRTNMELL